MNSLLVICACAFVAVVSSAPEGDFVISQKKCITDTGVSEDEVTDVGKGIFASDPKLAKYLVCVGKDNGMIGADNKINKKLLKKQMLLVNSDEGVVNAAIDKCVVEKANIDETSLEATKCLYAELH